MNADRWYPVKWKGDLFLFYTLANVLIEKGWVNRGLHCGPHGRV